MPRKPDAIKGRGAVSSAPGRFEVRPVDSSDPLYVDAPADEGSHPDTVLTAMPAKRIISSNSSPDIPFDRSINPYQGCEHGCIYCYARPSHSYLDLSPGLDFETRIFYKPNAAETLREEWSKPGYEPAPITIGANTDPYQPAEKRLGITRSLLLAFQEHRHPVSLITKGTGLKRDIDLLSDLAARRLCSIAISIPTANAALKRQLEPRVPAASARFALVRDLATAGVPVSVMMAPIIPALNDGEIESIVRRAADAGAEGAAWILLRLPHEVKPLFQEWLEIHYPERASHVMSLIRQASGGKDYDNRFGVRQTGTGPYASMIAQRFSTACSRAGLVRRGARQTLDCTQFVRPSGGQMSLNL